MDQPDVLFLVGTAHSGKTEVGLALRDQARALVVRRAYFWRDPEIGFGSVNRDDDKLERALRRLGSDELLRSADIDESFLAGLASRPDQTFGGLLLGATLEAGSRLANSGNDVRRLVIQVGGLERVADDVWRDLPGARFLHLVRDPRRYFGAAGSETRWGRLGWRLASWGVSSAAAIANLSDRPADYFVVRGEDIVEDPALVAASLGSGLGVDVDLVAAGRSLQEKGAPLSPAESVVVERLVGQYLRALGYTVNTAFDKARRPLDAGAYHVRSRFAMRLGAAT